MTAGGGRPRGEVFCTACRHYRYPVRPVLAPVPGNASAMREFQEWQEQERAAEQAERSSFQLGAPFYHPPQFYEWCRAWSDRLSREGPRDHAGRGAAVYALCARQNPGRDCALFEAGRPDRDVAGPTAGRG